MGPKQLDALFEEGGDRAHTSSASHSCTAAHTRNTQLRRPRGDSGREQGRQRLAHGVLQSAQKSPAHLREREHTLEGPRLRQEFRGQGVVALPDRVLPLRRHGRQRPALARRAHGGAEGEPHLARG
eukprot:6837909-Prymnesium_polylepis.1